MERHARWQLELSVAPSLYGQGEVLRAENVRSIEAAFAVKEIHVAMLAALAHLVATMPGIPDDHYLFLFILQIHLPSILYAVRDILAIEQFGFAVIPER